MNKKLNLFLKVIIAVLAILIIAFLVKVIFHMGRMGDGSKHSKMDKMHERYESHDYKRMHKKGERSVDLAEFFKDCDMITVGIKDDYLLLQDTNCNKEALVKRGMLVDK